ncbi:MAG: DUF4465 domain-containing protein [Bacteroidetes bacterium]|nr:DUF4465 domain-containing protein [Bacteroidota bacterium]
MKKSLFTASLFAIGVIANAQSYVETFETFTLNTNSFYKDTNSTSWQGTSAKFSYSWNKQYSFWSGGFSYTNKLDSSTGAYSNLYGSKAYYGYGNSNNYVSAQPSNSIWGSIKLKSPYSYANGFYITNTTYAYKAMKNGNSFSRKFGDTTGTHTGTLYPQGSYPDWFKITAKAYLAGSVKADSAVFYLADYRFTNNSLDYIVSNWQWFDLSALGQADSIYFKMYSSDVGQYGINTPLFFCVDNFTSNQTFASINENLLTQKLSVYPNPMQNSINVDFKGLIEEPITVELYDVSGTLILKNVSTELRQTYSTEEFSKGIYILKVSKGEQISIYKLIK